MKSLIRKIVRSVWLLSGPLRRPLARRFSSLVKNASEAAIREAAQPQLAELLVGVSIARREVGTYRNETNLLLDSLVRELTRLQDEVASLRAELRSFDAPSTISIDGSSLTRRELAESA